MQGLRERNRISFSFCFLFSIFALRDSLTSFVVDDLWSANAFSPVVVEPLPEFFCYGGTVDIDRVPNF